MSVRYWILLVEAGLEEVGISASPEQIHRLAEGFDVGSENQNMGAPDTFNGHVNEIAELKRKHAAEIERHEHAFHTVTTVLLPLAGYPKHSVTFRDNRMEVRPR